MHPAKLEHINLTVVDAKATAQRLCALFDWKIRWHGPSMNDGYTYHVGSRHSYIAVWMPKRAQKDAPLSRIGFNHIGIVVDNLTKARARVERAGYALYSFGNYEPGRRFYFKDEEGVEYEIIYYDKRTSQEDIGSKFSGFHRVLSEMARSGIVRK